MDRNTLTDTFEEDKTSVHCGEIVSKGTYNHVIKINSKSIKSQINRIMSISRWLPYLGSLSRSLQSAIEQLIRDIEGESSSTALSMHFPLFCSGTVGSLEDIGLNINLSLPISMDCHIWD